MQSFISSLTTAKIYTTPPSIETLSELFQDFYLQAESHISTHIQVLSSLQNRDPSPTPSTSSRTTTRSLPGLKPKASRDTLKRPNNVATGQQMLTPSELSERRRARRMLEYKRIALEEAVERRACEAIYDRIWRHKSSLDDIRDDKLRSKTAALSLVGIGLKDLGIELSNPRDPEKPDEERTARIESYISKAKDGLLHMNHSKNPLGKLQSLAATHQIIVDLLSDLHQSSSSADEILPTLIYTLIESPPEGINVISNLHFIQRFRSVNKVDGEAAYCLTNLEAAITFLENVDLATLRSEEAIEVSSRPSSGAPTPSKELGDPHSSSPYTPAQHSSPATTPLTAVPTHGASSTIPRSLPSPSTPESPLHQRRLSTLFQPPAHALGAASDAVRNTADQGFRNISTTLDSSFKLLFGRLKEQHVNGPGSDSQGAVIVPKTLDEARRLVSPKPTLDEDGNMSEASSFAEHDDSNPRDDRILEMITGMGKARDRSTDSAVSSGSGTNKRPSLLESSSTPTTSTSTSTTAVDSMRSLGNTLNPLNRLGAGISVMRGFGRSTTASSTATTPSPLAPSDSNKELKAAVSPGELPATSKVQPPIQRFLNVSDVGELKLAEVEVLLKDYQRLALALRRFGVQ